MRCLAFTALFAQLFVFAVWAQELPAAADVRQRFLGEQKAIGRSFAASFYPKFRQVNSLAQAPFLAKIDSARNVFLNHLSQYEQRLEPSFVLSQQAEIKYYFDKLTLEYPAAHYTYTGQRVTLPTPVARRLASNQRDFNRPELLTNSDFKEYVRAYLHERTTTELRKPTYARHDNQRLLVVWSLLLTLFTNRQCREFWQQEYLYSHIDNLGVKNLAATVRDFNTTCQDTAYRRKINRAYAQDTAGRRGHVIRPYKTVATGTLDLHLFLPPGSTAVKQRPAIVFFHGGSWSEGKPDWFF